MSVNSEISEYERSLLRAFSECCETLGYPYVHDFEIDNLRGFESIPVLVKDLLEKLSRRGYLEHNTFWTNSVATHWWQLTPSGMAAISDSIATKQPRPTKSSAPGWVDRISDPELRSIIFEVYDARENQFLTLPLIGARTAFDRAMYLKIGDPPGGFIRKLEAMKNSGYIDDRSIDILRPMIDAGNAAAHRGMIPTTNVLDAVIHELERQLHDWLIRDNDSVLVQKATPRR